MKNLFFAFVIFLSLNCSGQIFFQRTYGGYGSEVGFKAIALKNKDYALLGTSGRNTKLIIVDSLGNPKLSKEYSSYDSTLITEAFSFILTYDSGFVIAASMGEHWPNYLSNIILFKVNLKGSIVWIKAFKGIGSGLNYVNEIILTSDSGFAIIGGYEANFPIRFVFKTDSIGNLQWSKNYGRIDGVFGSQSIKQTPDKGYIITGAQRVDNIVHGEVCLIKIDSVGDFSWANTYGNGPQYDYGANVFITSDGFYLVTGYESPYIFLMKADSSGNVIWTKNYSSHIPGMYDGTGNRIIESIDSNYLFTGSNGSTTRSDIALIKTDTSGNIIWNRSYGSDGVDMGKDLIYDGNNYFILGNNSNLARGSSDFYFIKLDSLGSNICNYIDSSYTINSLIWSPSPFAVTSGNGIISISDSLNAFDSDTLNYNACGCESPISFFTISSVGPTGVNIIDRSNWGTSWYWDFGNGDTATYTIGHCWIPHTYSVPGIYIITCTVTNSCGTNTFSDTVDLITGINLLNAPDNKISIYPNPFSNRTTIKINDNEIGINSLVVYNSLGVEVIKINTTSNEFTIEKDNLSSGIYFLKCFKNGKLISYRKLIIIDKLN